MDDTTSYPPIEPSNFDLIVVGTGLPESIIAAAASAAGKTVLHLDPNPFYGTHSASLPLDDFISFLQSQSESPSQPPLQTPNDDASIPLTTRPLYSELEIKSYTSEPLENSRRFCLDLVAPRAFLCADAMIELILKTGINQYMEFKSVDASFVSSGGGKLESVPDSRSAIFKSRSLLGPEKYQLMNFFKHVQGVFENGSEEDLETPFVEFLTKRGLSQKLKSIILYTIAWADYDQEEMESCKDVISTKSGINRLALYHSSIGRFPNANGAIIYPIYGQGELSQAFCRRAAVKGCIYVLRMPVIALLIDKDGRTYQGVRLASGQELSSPQLILAPSFTIPPISPPAVDVTNSNVKSPSDSEGKVARAICIAKNSVKPEATNCLMFFPPRSLYPEQVTSVRVLQLSSNVGVCPSKMFVTYLSAVCDDAVEGKKLLNAAINALFSMAVSSSSKNNEIDNLSEHTEEKPCLLWSALYIQDLTMFHGAFDSIRFTPMPDGHLHYDDILDATEKLFKELFPNEDFFATTSTSDERLDDGNTELDP
ncbi:rab escort protein 1-like [Salvia miltiorrhiza]|uniref:rab escort protein 1-like n=1 Tax=Salvia miltiorrhiza TaxID=226208 RepID=UPI0025ABBFDD|nr:rab escort protein 1-like [Salvia miltiorrhiza]